MSSWSSKYIHPDSIGSMFSAKLLSSFGGGGPARQEHVQPLKHVPRKELAISSFGMSSVVIALPQEGRAFTEIIRDLDNMHAHTEPRGV